MHLLSLLVNKIQSAILLNKGYSRYYVNNMKGKIKKAYVESDIPFSQKKWAYKHGYYPWRIQQYDLNEKNYLGVISDEDYFYLYPLNSSYSKWIDDKLTTRFVLDPFRGFLPEYYYHLTGDKGIVKLMDCPEGYLNDIDSLIKLLKTKRLLVAKKAAGTHGVGFYKMEYICDNKFHVNQRQYKLEELKTFLKNLYDYIITEHISMHPEISKLYPNAVSTIRLTVINEKGNNPILPFAYMRIGTKKSGVVDNVAQGGIVCKIDINTGRFYDAEILNNHIYSKVAYHPDTHQFLEGIIPHWEMVKTSIIQLSEYIPELTWLGFDIAITQDGFKIVEINSHQELHKAHEYPDEVNCFLFKALDKKKKQYNLK